MNGFCSMKEHDIRTDFVFLVFRSVMTEQNGTGLKSVPLVTERKSGSFRRISDALMSQ